MIRAIRPERVIVVDQRQYSSRDRYLLAFEPVGVALAVPSFVMVANDRNNGVADVDIRQHVGADDRMHLHLLELVFSQLAWLVEDVTGNAELSNIVKQSAGLERIDLGLREFEDLSHPAGKMSHPLNMFVCGLILGIDCHCQHLQDRVVDLAHLLILLLLFLEFVVIVLKGPVDDYRNRDDEYERKRAGNQSISRGGEIERAGYGGSGEQRRRLEQKRITKRLAYPRAFDQSRHQRHIADMKQI